MNEVSISGAGSARNLPRSAGAVLLGFLACAVISLVTDQILHMLDVYPPWGQPMRDTGDNLLALTYRIAYAVLGGYVTARLAPRAPMRHVAVLGLIGLALSSAGGYVAITTMDLGPAWYPIALAAIAFPATLLGGVLYLKRSPS